MKEAGRLKAKLRWTARLCSHVRGVPSLLTWHRNTLHNAQTNVASKYFRIVGAGTSSVNVSKTMAKAMAIGRGGIGPGGWMSSAILSRSQFKSTAAERDLPIQRRLACCFRETKCVPSI